MTREAPSLPLAIAACGWQFKSLLQLADRCLPCHALHSPPPPFCHHSSIHTPASTAVCVLLALALSWLVYCQLCSFLRPSSRSSTLPSHPSPRTPVFPQCCPLVRPYAKQLQRQQLLRSWLLHCKCDCDCDSELETATTTTVSDAECNLSKKSRENCGSMVGQSSRDNALLWHKYECHQINMRRIWLTILWYNMLSECNGSCCCCYCCCCLGTLLAA